MIMTWGHAQRYAEDHMQIGDLRLLHEIAPSAAWLDTFPGNRASASTVKSTGSFGGCPRNLPTDGQSHASSLSLLH